MNGRFLILFCSLLGLAPSALAQGAGVINKANAEVGKIPVRFESSRVGSLSHHLLCLAGAIQCAQREYQILWEQLGLDAADKKALEELRTLDHALRRRRFGEDWSQQASVFPFPKRDQDGHMRLRAEANASASLAELDAKLAIWLTPEEHKRLVVIWKSFEPKFDRHWKVAEEALLKKRSALNERLAVLQRFIGSAHRFLASDWPEEKALPIYLVDRPSDGRLSHAEWLGDVAVLEVSDSDTAADLVRISAIQAIRALYANAPLQTHRMRQRALSAIESDALLPAYGLLDDALAYSLTDGILMPALKEKTRTRPTELVAKISVLVAPLTVPDFDRKVLDGSLAAAYVAKIALAEEKELSAPRHALRFVDVAFDRPLADARRELTRILGAERVNGFSPMDASEIVAKFAERRASFMSVVWLVRPEDVPRLQRHSAYFDEATLAAVAAQAKTGVPFAFGVKRDVASPAYLFVGRNVDELKQVFTRFCQVERAFVGLMR